MSALLEVDQLQTAYGASQVLFDIHLRIEAGGVCALLGRNGMGKTTTVRSVLGLTRSCGGTVRFRGERIEHLSPDRIARMGLAVVPEGRQIFPTLSVSENLRAFASNRNASESPWTLDRVYALFPRLSERSRNMGNQLSGGEQQMLAIGRALMGRPRLLLLDEPSFGLAPLVVKDIFNIMRRINREQNVSILLVEQNARLALDLADSAYLLETGRVVLSGTSDDMKRNDAVRRAYLGE